jgi:hypothetical protein
MSSSVAVGGITIPLCFWVDFFAKRNHFNKTIIEKHGGRILAENNPDGGATFFLELPVMKND